jgi:pyruvate, orthophosphate dikinase
MPSSWRYKEPIERHYREMQDLEFTVERNRLYMLQTRAGKRTAAAAVRIAVEMVNEGLITPETAVKRVDPEQVEQLLHPGLDPDVETEQLAVGCRPRRGRPRAGSYSIRTRRFAGPRKAKR